MADLFALSEAELRDKVFKVDLSEDQIQEVLAYGAKFPYIYLELGVTSLHPDAVNDASKRSSREITATFPAFDVLAISYTLKRETLEQHRERVATSKKPSEASSKAAEVRDGERCGWRKFLHRLIGPRCNF